MLEMLLGAILGTLFSITVTIAIELLRVPHLELRIPLESEVQDIDYRAMGVPKPAKRARWAQLYLTNKALPGWLRFLQRSPAVQCQGTAKFYHKDGQPVWDREMPIRWTYSPEPYYEESVRGEDGKHQSRKVQRLDRLVRSVDIQPSRPIKLDLAARYDDDEECYGWNNETYIRGWRNLYWKLDKGIYFVRVRISAVNAQCEGFYRLVNDVPIDDFRLVDALPEDKAYD